MDTGVKLPHQDKTGPAWDLLRQWVVFSSNAPTTQVMYMYYVGAFVRWMEAHQLVHPRQVTRHHLAQWVAESMNDGTTGASAANRVGLVRAWLRWLEMDGIIAKHPAPTCKYLPNIPIEKPDRRPITDEEFKRVLDEIDSLRGKVIMSRCYHPEWETCHRIGWHTGLRFSDCCSLRWDAVDFTREQLTVIPVKRRRVRQVLEIPMEEELVEHLMQVWQKRPADSKSQYVNPKLANDYKQHSTRSWMVMKLREIFDRANLPHLSFHSYRHAFVSRLLNAGVDPITISSMTGQTLQQIQDYAHVSDSAKRVALDKARQAIHLARVQTAVL